MMLIQEGDAVAQLCAVGLLDVIQMVDEIDDLLNPFDFCMDIMDNFNIMQWSLVASAHQQCPHASKAMQASNEASDILAANFL